MAIVQDLIDEWSGLANQRTPWEVYWRDIARYVLPQTQTYDMVLSAKNTAAAMSHVVNTPVASKRSKDLYDMTSLWAIERLTAGMLSLKTPESQTWHDLGTDSVFGDDTSHEEKVALERLRDYLFRVRANPNSGFWSAHRSAVKSMCAFGDGWLFIEELPGNSAKLPYRYQFMPLAELFPGVNSAGQPDRMFRIFRWSALQCAERFGVDKLPDTVKRMLDDPNQKHHTVRVMHAVRPREEAQRRGKVGVQAGAFSSFYAFPDDKHLVGEGGFNEFPFSRYAWSNSGTSPFSEGPIAYAIGEIKSLQEMAKNELIAVQTAIRPAYGIMGKNYQRLNLNPSAVNPGLVSPEGRPLFAPLNSGVRPDFAQAVMEARRNSVRELMYLNLWQIIIQDKNETATEALIRAQEKGELLGPVGISLNEGLSHNVDREVAILGRKRAFEDGSPLAMPDTMADADVSPRFTSPLDRMRRIGEIVGMQRLVEFAMMLGGGDPQQTAKILARFDIDDMLDTAQEILGAPVSSLLSREAAEETRGQLGQMEQVMAALQSAKMGGDAAQSIGAGATQLAEGSTVAANAPALATMMRELPRAATGAAMGAAQQQGAF